MSWQVQPEPSKPFDVLFPWHIVVSKLTILTPHIGQPKHQSDQLATYPNTWYPVLIEQKQPKLLSAGAQSVPE